MPKLDLVNAQQIKSAAGEWLQAKGQGWAWAKPSALPEISEFYGTGPGQVPIRLLSASAIMSGGFVTSVPNAGGAGTPFDLNARVSTIQLLGGGLDLVPSQWLRFSNSPAPSAPDFMGTTIYIVADLRGLGSDQYFLGNGSPQANVWLRSAGAVMSFNRRNPSTNSFEAVNVNLSPAVSAVKRLYEIEFVPGGAPNANGQTAGGTIRVSVNGDLRGSASHIYPEFKAWNFAAGQNPVNGNGLAATVYDFLLLARGGEYEARRSVIRQRLLQQHAL